MTGRMLPVVAVVCAWCSWLVAQEPPNQVRIVSAGSRPSADGVHEVELTVTNEGKMPTALDIAKRVKMVRPDTCTITLAKGQELAAPAAGQARQRTSVEIDWLQPGETKNVSWRVRGSGKIKVAVGSTRGGLDSRELELK
jgi:hypothetical protein